MGSVDFKGIADAISNTTDPTMDAKLREKLGVPYRAMEIMGETLDRVGRSTNRKQVAQVENLLRVEQTELDLERKSALEVKPMTTQQKLCDFRTTNDYKSSLSRTEHC